MSLMVAHPARNRPKTSRGDLLARTALCGALLGLGVATPSLALPVLGATPPQVSAGGGAPSIGGGATETDIPLHAPRTVIDWSSYNVSSNEKVSYAFDARNWIVLNRISDNNPAQVAGVVEGRVNGAYGGNIWFAAKNGMIFGAGAQIDAGGILASTAAPDLRGFLDPNTTSFTFPGSEILNQPQIAMQSGASITGHGGLVALIAVSVATQPDSSVSGLGGSSVLYGGATGFTLRLAQNAPGDFDLVDFVVSTASPASAPIDLQNTTRANSVFVAAVSSSAASSAVINLEGLVTATAATTDGGDIILSGGGGIVGRQASAALAGATPSDIYLSAASADRDILLQTTGRVRGEPWLRPPPPGPITGPPVNPCPNGDCGSPSSFPSNGFGPPPPPEPPEPFNGPETLVIGQSANDPTQISSLTAGRDIVLRGSGLITLGAAKAARDVTLDGAGVQANGLTVGRTASLRAETGDLGVHTLVLSGSGAINAAGGVQIDSVALSGGTLSATAAGGALGFGDGSGGASGGTIDLTAAGGVSINVTSATLDAITAGGAVTSQGGTLNINKVSAAQVVLRGGTLTVGQAASGGDIYLSATGDATLGAGVAGDDIYVLSSGGTASLTSATLTGKAADVVGATFVGNPDTADNGRVVGVLSTSGSASLGQGTGSVSGATAVNVVGGLDASVQLPGGLPGALTLKAGRDVTLSAPTAAFNAVSGGRDVTLITTAGDFVSTAPITAVRNLTLGAAGALKVGDINASSGSISLTGTSVTAGALKAGQDLTLKATSGGVQTASFSAGRDLTLQGSSLSLGQQLAPIGRDLSITTPGDFTAASSLTAGRNVTFSVGGTATLPGLSVPGTLDVIAGDINLTGAITATNLQIESASGALRVGGSAADGAPGGGMWLDNAELGRIKVSGKVSLYAGLANGSQRGDLTVLQLDVNPAATPEIDLLAGGGHNVSIQGVVAPTASGGVIQVGDQTNTAWRPTQILLSGSLGSALFSDGGYSNVRAFDHVRLIATQDIIMGSQRFIGLIQQAPLDGISISKNQPAGVIATGPEQNRVLVAAGDLEVSSQREVVAQNTSSRPDVSVGLLLTGANRTNLIIDPPQLVDVYGAFVDPSGQVVSSPSGSSGLSFSVVDATGAPTSPPAGAIYRFNSCAVGAGPCATSVSSSSSGQQQTPFQATGWYSAGEDGGAASYLSGGAVSDNGAGHDTSGGGDSGGGGDGATAAAQAASQKAQTPPLLATAPADPDAALAEPVITGAGSEEIWRARRFEPKADAQKPEARK
ncbi:MAG: filamentous hemagglutinin N-terminal domain-containing protein [Proteobacteria bacterium]|nr:filamentous hemagglutinin N-terminal domain-containing protein [Pseudomonadota bacterium]